MRVSTLVRRIALILSIALVSSNAFAQAAAPEAQKPFEPTVGQAGKDVVWVPTPQALVDKMLEMAKVTPTDYVMDLGSGDGRTVITAAKLGATAVGIEYNPDMVELSRRNATAAKVGPPKATFVQADLFKTDLSKASVITMFLLPSINMTLRPKLLNLRPGTRIVSNSFTMEDWEADETNTIENDCTNWCTALLWIVPAKVNGTWNTPNGALKLTQTFQNVTGSLGTTKIEEGKLRGNELTFTAGATKYAVRVSGSSMTNGGKPWASRPVTAKPAATGTAKPAAPASGTAKPAAPGTAKPAAPTTAKPKTAVPAAK